MKNILTFILLLAGTYTVSAQTREPMLINSEVTIDSAGNGIFEMSGKLNAHQWQSWNYMYGAGNASNLKRNIERTLSAFYVYDFEYKPNEMDRSFVVRYKAKGVVQYLGKDNWTVMLGLKETQPVKLSSNTFTATMSQSMGSGVMQTNMKVTLPADVTGMEFDKDEFGYVVVKYKRPTETVTTVGNPKMKTAGYALLGASLVSFLGIFYFRKSL
ncbi:MAG: hypothetical protein KF870_09665 [Leadbetterella sp.]|nr:hypothetical protein [Leadbetterella sp.]